jgi:hypothetical protein
MISLVTGTPISVADQAISGVNAGATLLIAWCVLTAIWRFSLAISDFVRHGKVVRGSLSDPLRIVCTLMLLVPEGGESAIQKFTIHPLLDLFQRNL